MNDIIVKYAKEVGLGDVGVKGDFIFFQPGTKGLMKFTELILRECIDNITDCSIEYTTRTQIVTELKEHFGIK